MVELKKKNLPLLPLRGIIIFPNMALHLDVGRFKSITALEQAMKEEELVLLVAQRDADVDDPVLQDLYTVGTVAKIKQLHKLPNNTYRVLVEGISRGSIEHLEITEQLYRAECFVPVEEEQEQTEETTTEETSEEANENLEAKALVKITHDEYEAFAKLSKKVSNEALQLILEEYRVGVLADIIAGNLPLKLEEKQEMLEIQDDKERLEKVISLISEQREILQLERKISLKVRKSVEKSQRDYYLREQMKVIQKELGDKEGKESEVDQLRAKITAANMPEHVERTALKELDRYEKIPAASSESGVIRNYLDWLISLPWSAETEDTLDISIAEGILNDDHYGLEKVKERILDYLSVQQMKQSLRGPILCLAGPPGVGKTSLAKSIARSLNRNFIRVSLGGVRDESEIRGHRRTYVGAMPGRIIQGMKKAGTINPVFLLDEIDKMTSDFRGDPASAMLEVLDPEQNKNFSDHYIEETYDLSKVLFIATANDLSTIPGPLRDRMEIITLSGYTEVEKFQIAKQYLVPKQLEEHGLQKAQLQMKDEAIQETIRSYTREAGVRSLERQMGTVCRKATRQLISGEKKKVVVTENTLKDFLGAPRFRYGTKELEDLVGVASGLAYTTVGGDTLSIEVATYPGKGKLTLTGKLGDVMKESAQAALSYIRSIAHKWDLAPDFYEKIDIHIHVPEGAVPKDGPSAGITMATAILSALTNIPIRKEVGMTGEITLRGRVLPIGGVKEKSLSAHRAGLKKVILPEDNRKDLEEVPKEVQKEMEFVFVSHLDEVLKHALVGVTK